MAYEVLARKWRPQQFDDVVGQTHVTRTLKNAIETERVAHAYMFVGSRGIGKTTSARILAKALNCEKGPTPEPCDVCDSCKEIMAGNNLDVIEIDGASNNGVDQVRDLRDNARYSPARGPFKIYIIDEVHMLSISAFNALLKILEEPPAHVKFLFATTDVHKVPATILSRCQRFDLRRISVQDIVERLKKGCKEEGIEISDDALLAIARGAEGGLRDAESALDQLISFRGKAIEEEDVLSVFGLVSRQALEGLAGAILGSDVPQIIQRVAEMDRSGKDMARLVTELLEHFRNILVVLYAGKDAVALELPDVQMKVYEKQAAATDAARILRVIDILVETDGRLRHALSKKTLLETGLIRCARAVETATIDQLLKQVAELKKNFRLNDAPPERAVHETASRYEMPADPVKKKRPEDELSLLRKNWHEIVDQVGRADSMARRYFTDTVPLKVEGSLITIGYDPEFAQEKERFEEPRTRLALCRAVQRHLERSVSASFEPMAPGEKITLPVVGIDEHADEAGGAAELTGLQKWYNDPTVKLVLEAFNGEIVDIRE